LTFLALVGYNVCKAGLCPAFFFLNAKTKAQSVNKMELEFGAEVKDQNGRLLGTVNHLVRDTWTGEIRRFVVRRQMPDSDLFLTLNDVLEIAKGKVKLNASAEELSQR